MTHDKLPYLDLCCYSVPCLFQPCFGIRKTVGIDKWPEQRFLFGGGGGDLAKMCVNGNVGQAVQTVYP